MPVTWDHVVYALLVVGLLLFVGFAVSLIIVRQVGKQLGNPIENTYNLAIAQFPDALILQFGYQQKFRDVPDALKITHVSWSLTVLKMLLTNPRAVVYANRRTAGQAITENPNITIREKILCLYRGFAICLVGTDKPLAESLSIISAQSSDGLDVNPADRERLYAELRKKLAGGRILVREDTDQSRALQHLFDILDLNKEYHIKPVKPPDDLLELASALLPEDKAAKQTNKAIEAAKPISAELAAKVSADEAAKAPLAEPAEKTTAAGSQNDGHTSGDKELPIIGFVGGITERLIGEKIGFYTIAEQPLILPDQYEINSFVYARPASKNESENLFYVIGEVEELWEETVRRIFTHLDVQEEFRVFLNQELRGHLGPNVQRRLKEAIFSPADFELLLKRWVRFPSNGPVSVMRTFAGAPRSRRRQPGQGPLFSIE
jgi:hypothetical protein